MGLPQRLILPALVVLTSGCAVTDSFQAAITAHHAPAPAQVVGAWNNKIVHVPDPANNGVPAPGLIGRVYLFGPTPDFPIPGNGSIVVDLFDDTPRNGQSSSVHLEQWRFDPESLSRLLKKDMFGLGYTLFLPWGSYRSDIRTLHLAVKYEPMSGMPLYAPSGPLTIEHTQSPVGAIAPTLAGGPVLPPPESTTPTLPMPRKAN